MLDILPIEPVSPPHFMISDEKIDAYDCRGPTHRLSSCAPTTLITRPMSLRR